MDASLLTRFRPFQDLDFEALATIARHARLLRLPSGRRLGRPGRPARGHYFLLQGAVRTVDGRTVSHGQAVAREPLISDGDSTSQVCTLGPAVVLWADLAPVAFLLRPEALGYRVGGLDGLDAGDWLRWFLGDSVIRQLRPVDLQALLRAFEARSVNAGEVVIQRGELGETFYVVADGGVDVSLDDGRTASLMAGDYFGEDALLTGRRRNATVRAKTDARLMALHRDSFWRLLGGRVVNAVAEMDTGRTRLSLNGVPLRRLRECCGRARSDVRYLVCGGDPGTRALAVFLLVRRDIDAVALGADAGNEPH